MTSNKVWTTQNIKDIGSPVSYGADCCSSSATDSSYLGGLQFV
jgi:hypothetical protein